MATKKKPAAPATGPVVEVKLPGDLVLVCSAPNREQWDRYLEKLLRGEQDAGWRELVQVTAKSHTPEQAGAILHRFPALARKIADSLGDAAGEDVEPVTDLETGTVTVDGVVFNAPDMDTWSSYERRISESKKRKGEILREFLEKHAQDQVACAKLLLEKPASILIIKAALNQVAGSDFEVTVKKG